ncbi:hypothetical protein V8E53_008240 [Lactarius tabidus]
MGPYNYLDVPHKSFTNSLFTNLDFIFQVHKDMTRGIKTAVESVVGSVQSADKDATKGGAALLDRLGDKLLGPTAESETNNASVIAPDATTTPSTQGRRSLHPDGNDPFRSASAPAPAPASETASVPAKQA